MGNQLGEKPVVGSTENGTASTTPATQVVPQPTEGKEKS
jgi:hypothetical protein